MNAAEMRGPPTVRVTLPLKVVNESNQRSRWATARRTKDARGTVAMVVRMQVKQLGPPPYVVTLTRIAPRNLDTDGVVSALKATRDGVADALGIDDGSDLAVWHYGQRRGSKADVTLVRGYGVEVRIEAFKLGVWPYTCRVKGCRRAVIYEAPGGGACSLEHRG